MKKHFENNTKNKLFLLNPNYKIPGIILVIIALSGIALLRYQSQVHGVDDQTELINGIYPRFQGIRIILLVILIIGLVCISWVKEKVEDEMFLLFRIRSIILSFVLSVFYVIIIPIIELSGGHDPQPFDGLYLVIGMLLVYLLSFFLQKKFVS